MRIMWQVHPFLFLMEDLLFSLISFEGKKICTKGAATEGSKVDFQ